MFYAKKPNSYLILGTSTDVGKTFFVTEICRYFKENGFDIDAIKPVISGFIKGDANNDVAKILQSLGRKYSSENIEEIAPFRLKASFSPLKAAKMENFELDFDKILLFCQQKIAKNRNKTLLIEGAGGVMTPINSEKTFLDLALALKIPVILIGNVYLGSISQILCAEMALKSQNIAIKSIIINDFAKKDDLSSQDIIKEVEKFTKAPVFHLTNIENYVII